MGFVWVGLRGPLFHKFVEEREQSKLRKNRDAPCSVVDSKFMFLPLATTRSYLRPLA
jgi:hypothetical protein